MKKILDDCGNSAIGEEILSLWLDYEENRSTEADLAHQLDKFEMIVQAGKVQLQVWTFLFFIFILLLYYFFRILYSTLFSFYFHFMKFTLFSILNISFYVVNKAWFCRDVTEKEWKKSLLYSTRLISWYRSFFFLFF